MSSADDLQGCSLLTCDEMLARARNRTARNLTRIVDACDFSLVKLGELTLKRLIAALKAANAQTPSIILSVLVLADEQERALHIGFPTEVEWGANSWALVNGRLGDVRRCRRNAASANRGVRLPSRAFIDVEAANDSSRYLPRLTSILLLVVRSYLDRSR